MGSPVPVLELLRAMAFINSEKKKLVPTDEDNKKKIRETLASEKIFYTLKFCPRRSRINMSTSTDFAFFRRRIKVFNLLRRRITSWGIMASTKNSLTGEGQMCNTFRCSPSHSRATRASKKRRDADVSTDSGDNRRKTRNLLATDHSWHAHHDFSEALLLNFVE